MTADRHAPDAHAAERATIVRVLRNGLHDAIDGDFLVAAGMRASNAGEDVPIGHATVKEVVAWAAQAGATALVAAGVRGPEAVARIEGERDELLREVNHLRSTFFASCPKSHEHGIWCGSDWVSLKHRAERAEARLAAVERLPNTGAPDEIEELWIRVSDLQAALRGDT